MTSLAPVLLIVIAIAGLAFGRDAAQNAIIGQLSGLMGLQAAEVLQSAVASASGAPSGIIVTIVGMMMITASGVFGELPSTPNAIWKAEQTGLITVSRLIRARAASLGLVAALGFLLMVSLVVSAALTTLGNHLNTVLAFGELLLPAMHFVVSLLLISALVAAIYKVLPDRHLEWRDVVVGGVVTAILFNIGKSLTGWYIGSSAVASSYGAAGALIVLLLWVYYSIQMFLLGAEFTKIYSSREVHSELPSRDNSWDGSGALVARLPSLGCRAQSHRTRKGDLSQEASRAVWRRLPSFQVDRPIS